MVLESSGVSRLGVEKNDYKMSYIETC